MGQYSEAAQREVWGGNPLAVASASIAPNGEAEPAPGGHRLRGRWSFASGCDYAQWLLLGGVLKQDGKTEERMFLVPVGAVEIVDDWHVMGLRGTGSKSVVIEDLVVPLTHSVSMHELKSGTGPGAAVHADNALYRSARTLFASFSLSSVLVGLAERAVDTFAEYTKARAMRGPRATDLETIQLVVAEAAAQAELAAMLVESTIERNIALVESRQPVTVEHLALTRRNSSYAGRLAQQVVTSIVQVAGGSALYDSNPLQEIFRDVTAGASHLSLTWHRAGQPYGRMRLGLPLEFDRV
jgi:alkylation response protein AidB-like acyl-CoA dehydrogenase